MQIAFIPDEDSAQSVVDLMNGVEEESRIAAVACHLQHGISLDGHFIKLVKTNDAQDADDDAIYEPDFGIFVNRAHIGTLDVECKPRWARGGWPYPRTNIAKHPMKHWQQGRFQKGRYTKKIQAFLEKPDTSFWVGVRADWQAVWILRAKDIFDHGRETTQRTRYKAVPLPIIAVSNQWGTFCNNADDFTNYIIQHLERAGIFDG